MGASSAWQPGPGLRQLHEQQRQGQLKSNPEMQITEKALVQDVMSNPDLMGYLITATPQMQQLMERSHMLTNPELRRRTMELA